MITKKKKIIILSLIVSVMLAFHFAKQLLYVSADIRSSVRSPTRVTMVVLPWVPHAIVRIFITNAALIILQTVRISDKSRNRGHFHWISHTCNLDGDRDYSELTIKIPKRKVPNKQCGSC